MNISRRHEFVIVFLGVLIITIIHTTEVRSSVAIDGCAVFPDDNIWNTPVDTLLVDPNSQSYISTIGAGRGLHADFGSGLWDGGPIGIPFVTVSGLQPKVDVFFDFDGESDPGPYPIPSDAPIEGGSQSGGDRHVLVVDRDNCILYEMWSAYPQSDGSWQAGSGAIFDLRSNALRPPSWTSADAAGLPILPGLVRYDEVASGEIRHAIRFTVPQTRNVFVWPARHQASDLTGQQYPPMGQRFRLKADYDISGFSRDVRVILAAFKKYGIILADNGSAWYISGVPDERWDNDVLHELGRVTGSAFEAVDESGLMVDPDSGQADILAACTDQPVRIGAAGYPTLPAAYAVSRDNDNIEMLAVNFSVDLILDRPVSLTFKGGYDCGYGSNSLMTTITGSVSVTGGAVTMENVIIR